MFNIIKIVFDVIQVIYVCLGKPCSTRDISFQNNEHGQNTFSGVFLWRIKFVSWVRYEFFQYFVLLLSSPDKNVNVTI